VGANPFGGHRYGVIITIWTKKFNLIP
jgi:hypothetical protein